jgi:hypothetical protein
MGPQAACLVEAEPRAARPGEFPPSRLNRLSPNTNPAKALRAAWRCLLIYGDFQIDAPQYLRVLSPLHCAACGDSPAMGLPKTTGRKTVIKEGWCN